jgi:DNA-binding winged helix-turn-helix (wHTH) protein
VLFRLLAALAERGGSATKEDLVREVWNEREYHPLRHDPKLQTAVRKLRVLVERDAAAPEIVLTWEEGYGLKLPVRIVRRR